MENQNETQMIEKTEEPVKETKDNIGTKIWGHLKRNWKKYVAGAVLGGVAVAVCKGSKKDDEDDEIEIEVTEEETVETAEE